MPHRKAAVVLAAASAEPEGSCTSSLGRATVRCCSPNRLWLFSALFVAIGASVTGALYHKTHEAELEALERTFEEAATVRSAQVMTTFARHMQGPRVTPKPRAPLPACDRARPRATGSDPGHPAAPAARTCAWAAATEGRRIRAARSGERAVRRATASAAMDA